MPETTLVKQYITPMEAMKDVNRGKNVRYLSSDGLINVRRKSAGKYELSIVGEKNSAVEVDVKTVMRSLTLPEYRRGLYREIPWYL